MNADEAAVADSGGVGGGDGGDASAPSPPIAIAGAGGSASTASAFPGAGVVAATSAEAEGAPLPPTPTPKPQAMQQEQQAVSASQRQHRQSPQPEAKSSAPILEFAKHLAEEQNAAKKAREARGSSGGVVPAPMDAGGTSVEDSQAATVANNSVPLGVARTVTDTGDNSADDGSGKKSADDGKDGTTAMESISPRQDSADSRPTAGPAAVNAASPFAQKHAVEPPRHSFVAVLTKPMGLTLQKIGDDSIKVSAIKPGSVADREGQVKIGDVLLAVNGKDVRKNAVSEAVVIIEKSGEIVSMLFSVQERGVSNTVAGGGFVTEKKKSKTLVSASMSATRAYVGSHPSERGNSAATDAGFASHNTILELAKALVEEQNAAREAREARGSYGGTPAAAMDAGGAEDSRATVGDGMKEPMDQAANGRSADAVTGTRTSSPDVVVDAPPPPPPPPAIVQNTADASCHGAQAAHSVPISVARTITDTGDNSADDGGKKSVDDAKAGATVMGPGTVAMASANAAVSVTASSTAQQQQQVTAQATQRALVADPAAQAPQPQVQMAGDAAASTTASSTNSVTHQARYSQTAIKNRTHDDGSVAPAVPTMRGDNGLFQRPSGRSRNGMEWDGVHGVWRPTSPILKALESMVESGGSRAVEAYSRYVRSHLMQQSCYDWVSSARTQCVCMKSLNPSQIREAATYVTTTWYQKSEEERVAQLALLIRQKESGDLPFLLPPFQLSGPSDTPKRLCRGAFMKVLFVPAFMWRRAEERASARISPEEKSSANVCDKSPSTSTNREKAGATVMDSISPRQDNVDSRQMAGPAAVNTASCIVQERAIEPSRNSFVAVLTKPMGLTLSGKGDGIKVSAIKPGSVADREGQVKIDDVLLAVNGKDVREKAVSEAVAIIEKSGETASMLFSTEVTEQQRGVTNKQTIADKEREEAGGNTVGDSHAKRDDEDGHAKEEEHWICHGCGTKHPPEKKRCPHPCLKWKGGSRSAATCGPSKKKNPYTDLKSDTFDRAATRKRGRPSTFSRFPAEQQAPASSSSPAKKKNPYANLKRRDLPRTKSKNQCGCCDACMVDDCGKCRNCLDMKRFGGPWKIRQKCPNRPPCDNPPSESPTKSATQPCVGSDGSSSKRGNPLCRIEGCSKFSHWRKYKYHGMCFSHFKQTIADKKMEESGGNTVDTADDSPAKRDRGDRRYVSPSTSATVVTPSPAKGKSSRCCVEGCTKYKQNNNHGMCRAHYLDSQAKVNGDRTQEKPRKSGPSSPCIVRGKPPATTSTRNARNKKGSELARESPGKRKRSAPTTDTKYTPPAVRVGEKVMKFFTDDFYEGKVKRLPTSGSPVFFVVYADGDSEEMDGDSFWAAYSDYQVQKNLIEPSEFVPDSLVIANDGRLATVRSFRPVSNGIDTEWSYHVHFTGWPATYDKWMLEVDLRKQTPSTLRWAEKVRASLRIKDRHSKKVKTEAASPSSVSQPTSRAEAPKVATKTLQRQSVVDHFYPLRNASSPGIKTDTSTKKPPLRRASSIGKPSSSQRPAKIARARMAPSTSIGCDVIMKQYPLRSSESRSRQAAIDARQKLSTPRKKLPKQPKKAVQRKNLSSKPRTDDKKTDNASDAKNHILPSIVVGTSILKYFSEGRDYFEGKITSLPTPGNKFYRIRYQDGDEEDMDPLEIYMAFSDWCVANDEIPLTKFNPNQHVYAADRGGVVREAVILSFCPVLKPGCLPGEWSWSYNVHFVRWHKRHDEWLDEDCLRKMTASSTKEKFQKEVDVQRASQKEPPSEQVTAGRKRDRKGIVKGNPTPSTTSSKKKYRWRCHRCDLLNDPNHTKCSGCQGWRGGKVPRKEEPEAVNESSEEEESSEEDEEESSEEEEEESSEEEEESESAAGSSDDESSDDEQILNWRQRKRLTCVAEGCSRLRHFGRHATLCRSHFVEAQEAAENARSDDDSDDDDSNAEADPEVRVGVDNYTGSKGEDGDEEIKGDTGAATSSAVGTARTVSVVTASSGSIGGGGGGQSSGGVSNLMDMIRLLKDSDDEDSDEDLFA